MLVRIYVSYVHTYTSLGFAFARTYVFQGFENGPVVKRSERDTLFYKSDINNYLYLMGNGIGWKRNGAGGKMSKFARF